MRTAAPRSSRAMLFLLSAGMLWLVVLLGGLAWWRLPNWAPTFTIAHAPLPDMVFRAAIAGGGSTIDAQKRLVAMGESSTLTLIEQLRHSDEKGRSLALNTLADIKDPRATEPIIAVLIDPRENLKSVAIRTLAAIGDPRAVTPLVALLKDRVHDMQAATALMSLPDSSVADALHPLLMQRQNPLVLITLHGNQDSRVPGWLNAEMRHPETVETQPSKWLSPWQEAAAEALAHNPQPDCLAFLLTATTDASPAVRRAAVGGLSTVITRDVSAPERQAILRLLDDPDTETRNRAAMACNIRGIGEAIPILLTLLDDPDPIARRRGTLGFGINLVDSAATTKLLTLLQDSDEQVRLGAMSAVGRLLSKSKGKDSTLLPSLVATCRDGSAKVRKRAIMQLQSNKDPQVTAALIDLLDDQDPTVAKEALGALNPFSRVLSDEQRARIDQARSTLKTKL